MKMTIIKVIIVAAFMALLLINVLGTMNFSVRALEFEVSLHIFNKGQTEILLPPVGSISAATHIAPVKIDLALRNIDPQLLQDIINEAPTSGILVEQFKNDLIRTAEIYLLRLLLLAAFGGMLGALLIAGRQIRPAVIGTLTGLTVTIVLICLTYSTYNVEKFRNPEFHGVLKAAPWAVGMAENALMKVNVLGEQMQVIAQNLYNLYERIENIKPLSEDLGDFLILHVSDSHNNPAAQRFLLQIVNSFPIDLVVDTGDISDYGTPLEGKLLTGLKDLQIPYLFVPGNHDSPDIMREIEEYPHVQVLRAGIVDIQGLRILALADPASKGRQITPLKREDTAGAREYLNLLWNESVKKPHLVAIHNLNLAENLIGICPLILYGHSHQLGVSEERGTILINAGTTGGAGLRGLQVTKEIPYSMVMLHLKRNEDGELFLTATDSIKVFNLERGFTLERKIFSVQLDPPDMKGE